MKKRWSLNTRFIIGKEQSPMMERWRLIQTPAFGVYVHFIYREDADRDMHDHPWNFLRVVLKGGYVEQYCKDPRWGSGYGKVYRGPWRPHYFPIHHAHRITAVEKGTVTLVIVGRKKREWGFWQQGRWTCWQKYVKEAW